MPPMEARAWWADVAHLREELEGRHDPEAGARPDLARAPAPARDDEAEPGFDPALDPPLPARRFARRDPVPAGPREPARRHLSPPVRLVEDIAWEDRPRRGDRTEAQHAAGPRRTVEIRGRTVPAPEVPRLVEVRQRRPPRPPADRVGARPDRVALWALLLGVLLILVAVGTADAATRLGDRALRSGMEGRDVRHLQLRLKRLGMLDAPATARFGSLTRRAVLRYQRSRCLTADGIAGAGTVRALRAGRRACRRGGARSGSAARSGRRSGRTAYLPSPLGTRTVARGMAGNDVRTVQRLLGVRATGTFGPITRRAVSRFQRRAGLGADGAVGPATQRALAGRRMRGRTVTWYGPGLYGNRTACGQRMTRRLRGVAHKTLPCGTPVTFYANGRFRTVRVVDRGPYTDGVTFDLTSATAGALGVRVTERIRAHY